MDFTSYKLITKKIYNGILQGTSAVQHQSGSLQPSLSSHQFQKNQLSYIHSIFLSFFFFSKNRGHMILGIPAILKSIPYREIGCRKIHIWTFDLSC